MYKYTYAGSPAGSVVKNPPSNAGKKGSIPGQERPHMPRGADNWARASQLLSPRSQACAPQQELPQLTAPRQNAQKQQWRPSAAKNKFVLKLKTF